MNTPIYDYIKKYAVSGTVRGHMPGHKGRAPVAGLEALYRCDITEICGADSLFEADGIIAESEKNMSSLYGTAATAYSAAGSTLCIQAMLAIMKNEGRRVIALRNVHRAFLNATALLDMDVEWSIPDYNGGILSGRADMKDIERLLAADERPACVYVTSPDYTGVIADIPALSRLCRKYGAKLIVDNAHGPHLAFMPENIHPIALGADMCCDSAHKMLPALTGAAMLHTSRSEYAPLLKQAMGLFASTSPSYPVMMSLDICNRYIAESIRSDISVNLERLAAFREKFSGDILFSGDDPFHVTIRAAESGYNGIDFAQKLRENGTECEYADHDTVILLMAPFSTDEDFAGLSAAVLATVRKSEKTAPAKAAFAPKLPEKAMSIREAVFAQSEVIPVEQAEGRICGAVLVPCPPAIPIAASGEVINRECINIFKRYGIESVSVVK
ncbi:MAG TPA: aminotransferase class V-fold PLP-dependent enzyme [Ruminococcus sp.]|nr:aminotransferase class V-fold PLP-dependent enzyme [Ruminococcus sp.]